MQDCAKNFEMITIRFFLTATLVGIGSLGQAQSLPDVSLKDIEGNAVQTSDICVTCATVSNCFWAAVQPYKGTNSLR